MIKAKIAHSTYYQGKMYRVGEVMDLADADFYALGDSAVKISGGKEKTVKTPESGADEKNVKEPAVNEMVGDPAKEKKVKVITK
jgi:hypothetical protein